MPNQGVPVIFKNKIAYGYAEKSVQAYDVSVSDYNALTEQQQLDGSIRFIQGVDAIPNGSNVWAKLGTTPLAEGLPRDCSQAVNQLKSNLTKLEVKAKYVTYSVTVPTTYTEYLGSATVNFYNLALNSSADFPTGKNILAIIPQTCSASSGTQRALVDIGAGDFSDPRAYIFGKGNNTYTLTILVLYTEP